MNKTFIRDFYSRILGSIEEDSVKKIKTARDFYGRILGTYDTKLDVTRDFYGKIVSKGDTLSGLIYAEANKNKGSK